MSTSNGLRAFLAQLSEAERARFEALENPTEVIAFLEERLVGLYDDLRQKGEEIASAQDARRIYKVAAEDADTRLKEQGQRHRDFALYLGRYLNDEIRDLDIPPEVPEELGQYGEFLLTMITELREKARRPSPQDTQKVVFVGGERELENLVQIVQRAVESDDPLATFRCYRGELPALPEEQQQRLDSFELFLTNYGHQQVLWEERQEQLESARETAGIVAEENESLRLRLQELQEGRPANGWEPQGYQPLVDGAIEEENRRLREEVERLTGEQAAAAEKARKWSTELQTEIAITRGARDDARQQVVDLTTQLDERNAESPNAHRQQRLAEKEAELSTARGQISDLEALQRDRAEEYAGLEREYLAVQKLLRQAVVKLYLREEEIVGLTVDLEARTAEYQNEQRQRRLAEQPAGEREQKLRTVTTERDAARGALQGQLDEVHYLEGRVKELTDRLGRYTTELGRIRGKHQKATEIVGEREQRYRATQQELEELRLDRALAVGLQDYIQRVTTERDSAQEAWHRIEGDYDKVKQRLHVQRQLGHSVQKLVATLTANVEKLAVIVRYGRQLCQTGADKIERLRGEVAQANDHATELAAYYEENVGGFTRENAELERRLEEAIAGLEVVNSQIEIYQQGMTGARVLTGHLVASASQPGREHSPLGVELVEPEEASPVVTEPVLDAMLLDAIPIPKPSVPPIETTYIAEDQTPAEQAPSVPLIRRTVTYHPRTIIAGLGLIGMLAAGSYGLYRFFTSESSVQSTPISQPLTPIQNAADLQRYNSALKEAYLEGIHHLEGREAIFRRLQETKQRYPLQNDALKLDYEDKLANMRRIVGITHK